jgi:branched-chain amino acid transport system permease protein
VQIATPARLLGIPLWFAFNGCDEGWVVRVRQQVKLLIIAALGFMALTLGVGISPASAADKGAQVGGTLVSAGKPVADVSITVSDTSGFTKTVTSGADGKWSVDVPKQGSYKITLDTATLPPGVSLTDPAASTRTVLVFAGLPANVSFPFGTQENTQTEGFLGRFLQLFANGIIFGLVIALAGLGLSMIYGTTGLTNFAHGELITLGAMVTYYFDNILEFNFILSALAAVIICTVLGSLQNLALWKPLRKRGTGLIAMLVISIGLGLFLRYVFLFFFGGATHQFRSFNGQVGISIGPVDLTPKALIGSAVAIALLAATGWWLLNTRIGKASRAVSDNPALASASGIDVERVINTIWALGAGLAAFSGILLAMSQGVAWNMGFNILLLVFAGVTLGGFGTAFGALVGSLIVGIVIELSTLVIPPELKYVGALVLLIVILLIRPQGILGRRQRVG